MSTNAAPLGRLRWAAALAIALTLAGCGGGNSGGSTPTPTPTPGPTPTPTPAPGISCTLRARQDWAAARVRENYLFPETLLATLDPTPYATVDDYIDALTATARAQGRDRFFTYRTSIAEEDAFFESGTTAAFGIRLQTDAAARTAIVADAYENAPALAAGIDRGTRILAIGTTAANLRSVTEIISASGVGGVADALGPAIAGTTRVVRVADASGARDLTITKADFDIQPVSPRFGSQVLISAGQHVGYVNLRTFISTADPALRSAFASFRAAGVTQVIVDLRYNGGGLVSTAELIGDLLGGDRLPSDVFSYTIFRPDQSQRNVTRLFRPAPESVRGMRLAFIGTGATASASELVMNAFIPYLGGASALVGSNTFGKPVGQIAVDRPECDDRLRIVAFSSQNAARQGSYFSGLSTTIGATCRADDQLDVQMGQPGEASISGALEFLAGRSCAPITATASVIAQRSTAPQAALLVPTRPTVAQREVPGTF